MILGAKVPPSEPLVSYDVKYPPPSLGGNGSIRARFHMSPELRATSFRRQASVIRPILRQVIAAPENRRLAQNN